MRKSCSTRGRTSVNAGAMLGQLVRQADQVIAVGTADQVGERRIASQSERRAHRRGCVGEFLRLAILTKRLREMGRQAKLLGQRHDILGIHRRVRLARIHRVQRLLEFIRLHPRFIERALADEALHILALASSGVLSLNSAALPYFLYAFSTIWSKFVFASSVFATSRKFVTLNHT